MDMAINQNGDDGVWHSSVWGPVCGMIAAVGYTAANCCLRAASNCDPVWVSCIKAIPTTVLAGIPITIGLWAGRPVLPDMKVTKALVLAALLGQLGGNVLFQYSLGVVGIGLAVPLCMGMIILASAWLARVYLHEPVSVDAFLSMLVLVAAIWVLSLGAGDAYRSVVRQSPSIWLLAAGVVAACFSGFAYAVLGVVIRYGVTGRASVTATTFVVCVVGVISLGSASVAKLGFEGILATTLRDWIVMIAAGLFNFVAFIALTRALQLASVVYVNAVNASQVAMAAVAGVVFFQESMSLALVGGVVLTVAGLLVMPRHKPESLNQDPSLPHVPASELAVRNPQNFSSSSNKAVSSQPTNSIQSRDSVCGSAVSENDVS
jgi:drug/metabolite transporter, DME family